MNFFDEYHVVRLLKAKGFSTQSPIDLHSQKSSIINFLPKQVSPHTGEKSQILSEGMMHVLCSHLPVNVRLLPFKMLYCVSRDGYSHHTMFRNTVGSDYSLLLLKDSLGHVFGAYLTGTIKNRSKYSGDGDSFVFTFRDGEEMEIYASTGFN